MMLVRKNRHETACKIQIHELEQLGQHGDPMPNTLPATRRRTALILRGAELPDCFLDATVEAAINAYTRSTVSAKASRRRLAGKVVRIDDLGMVQP